MSNKASQDYWHEEYAGYRFHIARRKDFIRRWIEEYIPPARGPEQTCLEIGCYPGRFISVFGELGYELSGIDLAKPRRTAAMAEYPWLQDGRIPQDRFHNL